MKNLRILEHPLLAVRLTALRDQDLAAPEFARQAALIGKLLAVESTRHLLTRVAEVVTPMEKMCGVALGKEVCLVPILRAGLAFLGSFREILPEASIGHLGIVRNEESLEAEVYLKRLPENLDQKEVFLLDPMLATGHSCCAALRILREAGAKKITVVCCVAAPEGVRELEEHYPEVLIITAALDRELNERGYILPGLGDFGDRYFGTL